MKCPFLARDEDLLKVKEGATCLSKDESGQLHMRKTHAYYYQAQCQLFVRGHTCADFVVWTQKSYHCEQVAKDEVLWEEMLPKARHFFQVGMLPKLLSKCYTRPPVVACPVNAVNLDSSETTQSVWCYCQEEQSGDMVACDSGSYQCEWFHYMCVGVLSEPKG